MADVVVKAGFAVGQKIEPSEHDLQALGMDGGSPQHRYLTLMLHRAYHAGRSEVYALYAQRLGDIYMGKVGA